MNLMNLMKRFSLCIRLLKKYARVWLNGCIFFFLEGLKIALLGSQRFICFINSFGDYLYLRVMKFSRGVTLYLMNLMNLYEVKILNRFFENVAIVFDELMNLKSMITS